MILALAASACSDDGGAAPQSAAGSGPGAGAAGMSGASGSGTSGSAGMPSGGSSSGAGGSSGLGGSGGSAAGSGAGGGSGGSAQGQVAPVLRDGKWALDMGDVTLEVDPMVGGRITKLSMGTENLLTGPSVNETYYGSTLWLSPETQWLQAPHVNASPYTAQNTATSIVLSLAADQMQGVGAKKTFTADTARSSFVIEYELTNGKDQPIQLAPWEVTRVFPRGLTFFPTGTKQSLSEGATMPTTNQGGVTWYQYDMAAVTKDSKLFADGAEGWVAHVAQGLVFIKKFADVTPEKIAPNEGDVELYTNVAHTYIELENQGDYVTIQPSQATTLKVEWFVRRLPAALTPTVGNMALTQFVRETIAP